MKPMSTLSIHSLEDFTRLALKPSRLATLDIGTKTIGIALSTPDWHSAMPLMTITRSKWSVDLAALEKTFQGFDIGGLVVGLPYNMDGSEGSRAQGVKQVVYNLIKAAPPWLDGPIAFIDERLSSAGATHVLEEMPRAKAKAKGALDAMAAQIILERALNKIRDIQ